MPFPFFLPALGAPFWIIKSVFFFLSYLPSSFLVVNHLLILQRRPTCFPARLTVLLPAIQLSQKAPTWLPPYNFHPQANVHPAEGCASWKFHCALASCYTPSSTGQSAPQHLWKRRSDPKSAPTSNAALCWKGWSSWGGGAHPVAQLDPGVHICPELPIPEEPFETQPWTTFMSDKLLDFSPR